MKKKINRKPKTDKMLQKKSLKKTQKPLKNQSQKRESTD